MEARRDAVAYYAARGYGVSECLQMTSRFGACQSRVLGHATAFPLRCDANAAGGADNPVANDRLVGGRRNYRHCGRSGPRRAPAKRRGRVRMVLRKRRRLQSP